MKFLKTLVITSFIIGEMGGLGLMAQTPPPTPLPTPPQEEGLPYSQTGRSSGLKTLQGYTAMFEGSRYGIRQGVRVRLSASDLIGGEAVLKEGRLWAPEGFISLLAQPRLEIPAVPTGLELVAPRWVYSPQELQPRSPLVRLTSWLGLGFLVSQPKTRIPEGVRSWEGKTERYYDVATWAESLGLTTSFHPRGLLVIGAKRFDFSVLTADQLDAVITLFDTPEKLADPEIATRHVPLLKAQGGWKDHARYTPETLALYEGPETEWPTVPESEYSLDGFKKELLGSDVPPPGVYPRLLFSEKDLPMLYQRIKDNIIGQMSLIEVEELFRKSWWDPKTPDGQAFDKLANNTFTEAEFYGADGAANKGSLPFSFLNHKSGIFNTHVNYFTNCLTTMGLYCLLTHNDELGKKVANASANLITRLSEPLIDGRLHTSDSENGVASGPAHNAETAWRGMAGAVSHCDIAFLLDFSGKWMTDKQRQDMQRIVAKAIYGRRDTHQAGPVSWRENNHATWHGTNFLCAMAIEGLPGCDPELFPEAIRHTRAFLDYGIDASGQIFESNGKSGGGINFQVLNMIALARRGHNFWGHPHWRKLLKAQVLNTSPDGKVTVSSGTFSGSRFVVQTVMNLKGFYPGDRCADYLLGLNYPGLDLAKVNLEDYRQQVRDAKIRALRLVGPTYSGWTRSLLYDTDWRPVTRADLSLETTFETPTHGILSAYSDASPNAAWLNLHVRSNQYYGAGHHHNDSGMIHFSSGETNWIMESPFAADYSGRYHNLVTVDGKASYDYGWAAPGKYLGAKIGPEAAFAACDLAYSYSWTWLSQPPCGAWDLTDERINRDWELDTHPMAVKYFKGTQHWKMRPWWPSYLFSNWYPVLRSPWNPMESCFRTAGLVRGPHPYALVVDDLKKDGTAHDYQWRGMLENDIVTAEVPGLPKSWLALFNPPNPNGPAPKIETNAPRPPVQPQPGSPLLLVVPVLPFDSGKAGQPLVEARVLDDGPKNKDGKPAYYNALLVNRRDVKARFRVLLVPYTAGSPLPVVSKPDAQGTTTLAWADQKDEIRFTEGTDGRTRVLINRQGTPIATPLP